MNVGGIGEGSDLVSDWFNLCYLSTKILGENRFGFRRGKETKAACVNLSFQTNNYICLTLRLLMSYIYGAPILDVSRSHTTTHHSR